MTPEFPFLRGTFSFAESSVPYLQLLLSASDALAHLRVARELIFDPREIVLEELFQRDIDDVRVQREIAPYLLRQGEVKFFNALVVVLLPHRQGKLLSDYPTASSSVGGETTLEGIELEKNSDFGTIRWDPSTIYPIIVDGQHRFSALKEVAKNPTDKLKQDLNATTIPVILLALHESFGFRSSSKNLLSTVRRVFIDLNRQAKTVSETRNILLDDRDIAAVAVRALIEKQVKSSERSLSQRLNDGHIPLALVDWYSDKLRFDHGLHITSILSLYQIIVDFLDIPRIDPYDYEKSYAWLKRFLELSPTLNFTSTVQECIQHKQPVFLKDENVETFVNWFETELGPAVTHVLTHLEPYRRLIDELKASEFLDGPLEIWAALDRAGKAAFEKAHGKSVDIHERESSVAERKLHDLAFQVVFQRGVLRAFLQMCQVHVALVGNSASSETPGQYALHWVTVYNDRIGDLSKDSDFWTGTVIRGDGSINATRTAEKSVAAVVMFTLLAPFSEWRNMDSETRLAMAMRYIHESYENRQTRKLPPWEKLKKTYGQLWRSLVRKFLQETRSIYGPGESEACSRYMAERVCVCMRKSRTDLIFTQQNYYVSDPLIDLLTDD